MVINRVKMNRRQMTGCVLMNKIQFDIISPHWERFEDNPDWDDRYVEYAQISIIIDGKDIFNEYEHMDKPRFAGIDPETFLFNKNPLFIDTPDTNKLNGTILIGVCNACFFEWCDDLYAEISTENNIVKWNIVPDRIRDENKEYFFDLNDYINEIEKLYIKFNDYEWEDRNHKIRRLCDEYIKGYKTKDGKNIEGVRILGMCDEDGNDSDKLSNQIEILCENYQGRVEVEWDGETLESALKNLILYAEQNLIKK